MEITSKIELVQLMEKLVNAGVKGQFVCMYGEKDVKLNKNATDGTKDIRPADFCPTTKFHITFNFGRDYEKAMTRILGKDYTAHDNNRRHLVKNVLMEYVSTSTMCLIYMADDYKDDGTFVNGQPASESDIAMIKKFKSTAKGSEQVVPYRTIGVKNITKIVANGEEYHIRI